MSPTPKAVSPREMAKWGTYALLLLAPGSLIVLPLAFAARYWWTRSARLAPAVRRSLSDHRSS